jgi:superfamily II DNA or RNA helicase
MPPNAPDDAAILAAVGEGPFHRGLAYAREGRVSRLVYDAPNRVLTATVRGSGGRSYTTVVNLGAAQPDGHARVAGWCTCPVGVGCKHVAAVVLAARAAGGRAGPGGVAAREAAPDSPWEAVLAPVVAVGADPAGTPAPSLALQFEVARATPSSSYVNGVDITVPRVLLRPVARGAKGGWVRSGVSWRELAYGYGRVTAHPAEHREALRALHAHAAARSPFGYGYQEGPIDLATVGPVLWRLLDDVVAVGVPLVLSAAASGAVVLDTQGVSLSVDMRRDPQTDGAWLESVLTFGTDVPQDATVHFVGAPVHGVFAVPAAPAGAGGRSRAGSPPRGSRAATASGASPVGLLLAPLRERITPQLARLMQEGRVRIPPGDVERFLRDYSPALRRAVVLTSSDGSVTFPEVQPPSLGLIVTHAPGHRVGLEWFVRYRIGGEARRVGLGDRSALGGYRDPAAEQALVAGVPLPDGFPELRAETGAGPAPTAELTGMRAVGFLEDVLPALREAGVAVEEVGEAVDYRLTEAAPLISVSATESGERDWFDLGVRVSIDGEDVPFVELFVALARGESHLLLASGTYFPIQRPEYEGLRRLIEEARALEDHRAGPPRISRYQVGLWEDLAALGVVEAQSARWAEAVRGLSMAEEGLPRPPAPESLRAELRHYQLDGFHWLRFLWEHELGGVLADDMGLGKTVQVLAAVVDRKERGLLAQPVLVVAPTSVVSNWAREAERFAPGLTVATVTETERRRGVALAGHVTGADVVVTSYALFRLEADAYRDLPWSALVLDEAQFVKNHQAKTYQCARRLPAPVKVAITGTPLENGLMDLWSMLSIVAPGLFPSPARFTEVFRTPIEREGDAERLATLRRRIRPLVRRRTKEQVAAELPPKVEQVLEVELGARHRKIYDTHLQRERQKVLGMIDHLNRNRFEIFRSLTILRQLSLDPALVDEQYARVGSAKVEVLLENLRDVIDGGHRALVFSQFTRFLRVVRDRLDAEGVPYAYLDGRTRNRAERIAEFRAGGAPVFLISLKAGGFGLNLTEADYCFVLDPWWNPAVEAQAVDRAHRIGQDKTVMVYRLVAAGTIEEKVMALKAKKQDLFARVVEEDGVLSGALTAEDVRGLFA